MSNAPALFEILVRAIVEGELIEREGKKDKEFHFQNWVSRRFQSLGVDYDQPGRNSYPDFRLVYSPEGYEIKGLAYPGREADYDCNSQIPRGVHNGRQVYYVFGRYPEEPDGNRFPVLDLVVCHGSFLNADNTYVHKNRSFRGFGSYGDIMVRDRKMYVAPTPFALAEGTAHRRTLILPADDDSNVAGLVNVGTLERREVDRIAVAYNFDLRTNVLATDLVANPNAGRVHRFNAFRTRDDAPERVVIRDRGRVLAELDAAGAAHDEEDEE